MKRAENCSKSAPPSAVAMQRLAILKRYERKQPQIGAARAALKVGVSIATLWRWQKQYDDCGIEGLEPKWAKCGAKRAAVSEVELTAMAVRKLEYLLVRNPPATAWRRFARDGFLCPPNLARYIIIHGHAPASLLERFNLKPVKARVLVSADGRRLYFQFSGTGTVSARIPAPKDFRPKLFNGKKTTITKRIQ